ncbi:MAG TPA: FHA domain-containing protein [Galbitalea sp.]
MDDELDETITVPRLPTIGQPMPPLPDDVEATVVTKRSAKGAVPPTLVEPPPNDHSHYLSAVELISEPEPLLEAVSTETAPFDASDLAMETKQFYRFRIGKTVVWLDAVSYVGRRPSSPRIIYGQMPRLVMVPSPKHEVSSTHVELRQLGSSVVLTDMRSTNGSIVFPPGGAPRKLRQGESVVATPGTLVDIGDGNVIEILPLESRPRLVEVDDDPSEGRA